MNKQFSSFVLDSYLFAVLFCPLRRDRTIGPSSEWGGLFLLTPLIPLHTSIMVNLVAPWEPTETIQLDFRGGNAKRLTDANHKISKF